MSTPEKPKRLTQSQILEMLLLNRAATKCQVTLTVQPNGDVLPEVRAVADDVQDAEAAALASLSRLREQLAPPAVEGTPAKVSLTRNAKGETQIDVEARGDLTATAAALAEQYEILRGRYPLADGTVSHDKPKEPQK